MWHPDMPAHYRDAILTGDARELARAIPDESVDLVFTDPVYDRVADYEWLGREARRVLRPGGAFLAFCGIGFMEATMSALRAAGAPVRWVCGVYLGGSNFRIGPRMFCKWTALLWVLGEPLRTMLDMPFAPLSELAGAHPWKKPVGAVRSFVAAFSELGAVVFDPFTGGGTVPAVCKQLGRHYIAMEIDPDTAARARQRVRDTPMPLPFEEPARQESLFLEAKG